EQLEREPADGCDVDTRGVDGAAEPLGERFGEGEHEDALADRGTADRRLAREQRLAAAGGAVDQDAAVRLERAQERELPLVEPHAIVRGAAHAQAERQARDPGVAPERVDALDPLAARPVRQRQCALDKRLEGLAEPAEWLAVEGDASEIVRRGTRAARDVGERDRHAMSRRLAASVAQALEEESLECERLLERRRLHPDAILVPETVDLRDR